MRDKTTIFSIFGQIEAVVAENMIVSGEAVKIPQEHIPESALFNAKGERAKFAVSMSTRKVHKFEERISQLYA